MKLVAFPLFVLITISMLGLLGLSSAPMESTGDFYSTAEFDGFYDAGGNLKAYPNGTVADEFGHIVTTSGQPYWANSTGNYVLYRLNAGDDVDQYITNQFNMGTTLGLIAIVVGLMALALVAGLRVLGTGASETSVKTIIIGTGLLALWGVFSASSFSLITSVPIFGAVIYFGLTAMFTLGVMQQVSGDSS